MLLGIRRQGNGVHTCSVSSSPDACWNQLLCWMTFIFPFTTACSFLRISSVSMSLSRRRYKSLCKWNQWRRCDVFRAKISVSDPPPFYVSRTRTFKNSVAGEGRISRLGMKRDARVRASALRGQWVSVALVMAARLSYRREGGGGIWFGHNLVWQTSVR